VVDPTTVTSEDSAPASRAGKLAFGGRPSQRPERNAIEMSRPSLRVAFSLLALACGPGGPASEAPPPPPQAWAEVVGDYAVGPDTVSFLE
jgi:hypothetical protein